MAEERIEIEPVLESVLRYCLKDAQERMEKGEVIVPFSALAVGETLFMEEHPGDEPAESFSAARRAHRPPSCAPLRTIPVAYRPHALP